MGEWTDVLYTLVADKECEKVPNKGRVLWFMSESTAGALETVLPLSVREVTLAIGQSSVILPTLLFHPY